MAGGIAHDFNNILAAILGYGDMAQNAAAEGSTLKRYVGNVLAAAHRAKALIDQILTYSRSNRGQRTVVNVDEVVEETLDLVRVSLPADIELCMQVGTHKAAVIPADPTHIHQLIMNLCRNAEHAMSAGGKFDGCARCDRREGRRDTFPRIFTGGPLHSPARRRFRLRHEHRELLRESSNPSSRRASPVAQPDWGLHWCKVLSPYIGGAIDVASQPDQGSTFDVYLPRSNAEAIEKAEAALPLPRGHGERVLLVEDEKPLMLLTEEMLAAFNLTNQPDSHDRPKRSKTFVPIPCASTPLC